MRAEEGMRTMLVAAAAAATAGSDEEDGIGIAKSGSFRSSGLVKGSCVHAHASGQTAATTAGCCY